MNQVLDTVPRKVTPSMNESLNAPYTQMEVKNDFFHMFPLKAPGADGYLAHFFSVTGRSVGTKSPMWF